MPYSALHAMMCCHTNEVKPRSPVLPFFLTIWEFVFFRFPPFFEVSLSRFDFFLFLSDQCSRFCANEYRDWSEIRNDERMSRVAHKRKRKNHLNLSANTTALIFVLPPFDSAPRRKTSSLSLCTRQKNVKSKKKKQKRKTTVCLNDEK